MKKSILFVIMITLSIILTSCNTASTMKNKALPGRFISIEFYNGGGCIGSYKNVSLNVLSTNSTSLTNEISFYLYHIYDEKQEISEYIIDSEALSIKYKIEDSINKN